MVIRAPLTPGHGAGGPPAGPGARPATARSRCPGRVRCLPVSPAATMRLPPGPPPGPMSIRWPAASRSRSWSMTMIVARQPAAGRTRPPRWPRQAGAGRGRRGLAEPQVTQADLVGRPQRRGDRGPLGEPLQSLLHAQAEHVGYGQAVDGGRSGPCPAAGPGSAAAGCRWSGFPGTAACPRRTGCRWPATSCPTRTRRPPRPSATAARRRRCPAGCCAGPAHAGDRGQGSRNGDITSRRTRQLTAIRQRMLFVSQARGRD
jgi:hypothetical protein